MIALAITLSVIIILALLRFGVIIEYGENGFLLWAKVIFLKIRLLDDDKPKKKKKKKEKKPKDTSNVLKQMLPGSLSDFMEVLRAVKNILSRLRRRLLIKQLSLYFTSASEDPANTALQFGGANAVFSAIIPGFEKNFRIRKLDLRTFFDFDSDKPKIYAKVNISIAVWEVFYIAFALFPLITSAFKKMPKAIRKDGKDNGKSPDKRTDGNNNAENEGTD